MISLRNAMFHLGVRLGRYQLVRLSVAGLEPIVRWTAKIVLWGFLAVVVVMTILGVGALIMQLNYAPLWLRVYNRCVDTQPEAVSITKAIDHHAECSVNRRSFSSSKSENMRRYASGLARCVKTRPISTHTSA